MYRNLIAEIVALMLERGYKPMSVSEIASKTGVGDEKIVRRALEELKAARIVNRASRGGYLALLGARRAVGVIRMKARGFGFMEPIGGKPAEELFVPKRSAGAAMDGDLVLAELGSGWRDCRRGRTPVGRVIRVLQRASSEVVGTLVRSGKRYEVAPDMIRGPGSIRILNAPPKGAAPGDKVVVEIDPKADYSGQPVGRVVGLLGRRGDPFLEQRLVASHYGFSEEFPEDVLTELRGINRDRDRRPREDFRDNLVVTIDPEEARDFDDAVGLTVTVKGTYLLEVHIADVAHFVKPGSALDREARRRATSVYLPGFAVPMLPEKISGELASLVPGRDRPTKSVFIEMTQDGDVVSSRVTNGLIRSTRRLTYRGAQEILDGSAKHNERLSVMLAHMKRLADKLRARRMRSGALDLDMPEIDIHLDKHGRVTDIGLGKRLDTHKIIEEFMLIANKTMADWFARKRLSYIRRIHEEPNPEKLAELSAFVRFLGLPLPKAPSRKDLQNLLDRARSTALHHAVTYSVLRCFRHAAYSAKGGSHYALAETNYMHFTSPIRRYPDLYSHQVLDEALRGRRPKRERGELATVARWSTEAEIRAEEAEREATAMVALGYLEQFADECFDGIVTGANWNGIWVELVGMGIDGRVAVGDMPPGHYAYEERKRALVETRTGETYGVGRKVRVRILEVRPHARLLDLALLQRRKNSRASDAT